MLTKSSTVERIKENFASINLKLTPEQVQRVTHLNKNLRIIDFLFKDKPEQSLPVFN